MSGVGHGHGSEHGHGGPENKRVALLIAALGGAGVVFCGIGFFAPTAVHLF